VLLITGTRKGIGKFLVDYYVAKGYLVEGCSRSLPDWEYADTYTHHAVDVTDEMGVKKMISDISRRHGRLDIVINNAGIASMNHSLLTPVATVDRIMSTNFLGTFLVCRESAKLMKRSDYGRIVNMGSVAAPMDMEGEAIYAASKSAIVTLTRILAHEFASFGITCNCVGPTPTDTDLIRGVQKEKIQKILDRLAIKRLATLEDIANVIDFFIKPESSYVTGQTVYLGGV
jgi:3-oxoacyl-[acyl-carrier protein] reductase